MSLRLSPILILAVGLLLPTGAAAQDVIGIAHGSRPAAITIEDLDGNPVDLGQFIGRRPTVIEFWATWCPLCAELQPRLDAAHARYGDSVQFLAVAVAVNQTKRTINRHLERHPIPFPMLWDTDGRAVRAFQAPSTSYIVVLDAQGRVVYTGIGGTQDIDGAVRRALASR